MAVNKRTVGSRYEVLASEYLISNGYRIVERNYHAGKRGEIDIIAKDKDDTLVICEVKYRKNKSYGDPLEAVTYAKQRQICRVTLFYFMEHRLSQNCPCRFDVIAIYGDDEIVHIKNAFDFVY